MYLRSIYYKIFIAAVLAWIFWRNGDLRSDIDKARLTAGRVISDQP